jgi:hypothetical protein
MPGGEASIITVLIDTYNYRHYIGRAIESVVEQTYPAELVDILVVDDGSEDGTDEVVRRFGERVRYIWKENGGQASAFNVGFEEARGDLICLLDADDYFYPEKLSHVADLAATHPDVGLIYTFCDIVDSRGNLLHPGREVRSWKDALLSPASAPQQLRSMILLGDPWTGPTSTMTVRRSAVKGLKIPEEEFRLSPDLFLGLVLPFRTDVAVIERPLTGYVYHGGNVGLFRSSAANQRMFQRQMGVVGRFLEEHHGVERLQYFGRGLYEDGREHEQTTTQAGIRERIQRFRGERRVIAQADVAEAIKRRSKRKLWLSFLLPERAYITLQRLPAFYRRRRGRSLQRALESSRKSG